MLLLFLACAFHAAIAGPSSSYIENGQIASKGQFPYQVSVRVRNVINNYNHKCGGVLVDYQHVLTAAQCVRDLKLSDIYVVAGTNSLSVEDDPNGAVVAYPEKITIHPSYNSEKSTYNDLAIIKLNQRLPDREDIRPTALLQDQPQVGTRCTVSGWGVSSEQKASEQKVVSTKLRSVNVSFVQTSQCSHRLPSVHNDEVCAEPTGAQAGDACVLDNGGPLVCDSALSGVYSWSRASCGTPDSPGVYSSVAYHSQWIRDNSESRAVSTNSPAAGTSTMRPGGPTKAPTGGSTRPPAPTTPNPFTQEEGICFILSIVQIILMSVVLLIVFVLVLTVSKSKK